MSETPGVLAEIVDEIDDVMEQAEADMAADAEAKADIAAEEGKAEVDATDLARKMAKDYNILLSDVKGTGKDGRVTVPDVDKHRKALEAEAELVEKAPADMVEPEIVEAEEEKPRPITKKIVAGALLPNVIVGLTEIYHIVRSVSKLGGMGWHSSRVSVADVDERLGEMLLEGWELVKSQPLGYGPEGIDMFWVLGKFAEDKVTRYPYTDIMHMTRRVGGGDTEAISGTQANALISGYLQTGWDLALVEALDKAAGGVVNVMWILLR